MEPGVGLALGDGLGLVRIDLGRVRKHICVTISNPSHAGLCVPPSLSPPHVPPSPTLSMKMGWSNARMASNPTTVSRKSKGGG